MGYRIEVDSLGQKKVPEEAYYGIQTLRAVENFPVSGIKAPKQFIYAYIALKKAAAFTNVQLGELEEKIGKAIVQGCEEVLHGKMLDQFVVDVFQAGAGTSFNMNVNEVLANRALEVLGKKKGDYTCVSPNDHVNMGQSTNDTFPTALHVSILTAMHPLLQELNALAQMFEKLGKKNAKTLKSGRTHLQDALPVTIGQEFVAYGTVLEKCVKQLSQRSLPLFEVALGGTATGTGLGAHQQFGKSAISELAKITGLKLRLARNRFAALQSRSEVAAVSSALKELALELIRIANDLRLLSSGPTTGFAEISLPAVQPGSSIMPGKVNPVLAECLDMIGFQIAGNDLAICMAVQAGQLELNVMTPLMMHNILQSIELLTNFLPVFRKRCVAGIKVDKKKCLYYVDKNPSVAVLLSPKIGYLKASKIAQEALRKKRSVRDLAVEKRILTPEEANKLFSTESLMGMNLNGLSKKKARRALKHR